MGHQQVYGSRAAFRFEVPTRVCGKRCRNFKSAAPASRRASMDVIPVIDIKGGIVVHARMGRRDEYRPIATPLSATADPLDVVRGLLSVHPFGTLYIADLDAIERAGDNSAVLRHLRAELPGTTFWVDRGIADHNAAEAWLQADLGHLVLGSE